MTAFNLDANPRNVERSRELFRECIEIVRKACTEKYFEHIGEHYRIPPENTPWTTARGIEPDPEWVRDGQIYRLGIVPKPYQAPHPAFSMACSSDSTVEFCASLGLRAMGLAPAAAHAQAVDRALREGDGGERPSGRRSGRQLVGAAQHLRRPHHGGGAPGTTSPR